MIRTKAIVLNRTPHKENDALVHFYTLDFGKIILAAKGARKQLSKLAAHMEPLNFVELMMIKNKTGFCVGSVISQNSFLNIKKDYNSLYLSGKILSFFLKHIKEGESDFELFIFLNDFLKSLDQQIDRLEKKSVRELDFLGDVLIFKLLKLLGYSFQTSACVDCGAEEKLSFLNFNKGGVVCVDCVNKEIKDRLFDRNNYLEINEELLLLKNKVNDNNFDFLLNLEINDKFHNLIRRKIKYLSF